MFSYFMLRTEQQLFCYLYGGALALSLQLLFSPSFPGNGFILVSLPVALFWAGLALYTRHIDQMRKPDVSPLVSIRDGIQVVAMLPRHEKARLEWKILQDDGKRAARTVLTGMCYSVGSATRQGSSSLTRFIGQSAMTSRT